MVLSTKDMIKNFIELIVKVKRKSMAKCQTKTSSICIFKY